MKTDKEKTELLKEVAKILDSEDIPHILLACDNSSNSSDKVWTVADIQIDEDHLITALIDIFNDTTLRNAFEKAINESKKLNNKGKKNQILFSEDDDIQKKIQESLGDLADARCIGNINMKTGKGLEEFLDNLRKMEEDTSTKKDEKKKQENKDEDLTPKFSDIFKNIFKKK